MKILLSAYACEPDRGSEPGVGWAWANSLCNHAEVTVMTRANNEEVINAWYEKNGGQENRPSFVYYDPPVWVLWLKKKRLLPVQLFYIIWQFCMVHSLRKDLRGFDIVHHVTFNSMMLPGCFWFSPIPVILGPLGGTSFVGEPYKPLFGKRLWKEWLREFLIKNWTWLPWIRCSFDQAAFIFCANTETKRQIDRRYPDKTSLMLETGISGSTLNGGSRHGQCKDGDELHLIWIGTIEPWKALTLALRGLALALEEMPEQIVVNLDVVGTGSELEDAKSLACDLGIADNVKFRGWVVKSEVDELLARSSALLFTSVKDTSGNVVLEAMSQGIPVICINHQGVADITTDETAIRIEPGSMHDTIRGVADAVLTLARQPQLAESLGAAGYQRIVEEYTWEQKAAKISQFYDQFLNQSR